MDKFNQFNLYSMKVSDNTQIKTDMPTVTNFKNINFDSFMEEYKNLDTASEKLNLIRTTFNMYDGEKFFEDKKTNKVYKIYISGTYMRIETYSRVGMTETGTKEQLNRESNK